MSTRPVSPLEQARRAAGLTQQQLADRAGMSRDSVSRAERGRDVALSTARVLSAALGVSLDVFAIEADAQD